MELNFQFDCFDNNMFYELCFSSLRQKLCVDLSFFFFLKKKKKFVLEYYPPVLDFILWIVLNMEFRYNNKYTTMETFLLNGQWHWLKENSIVNH